MFFNRFFKTVFLPFNEYSKYGYTCISFNRILFLIRIIFSHKVNLFSLNPLFLKIN